MTDVHIHIERGPYTREWISRFADQAVKAGLDEIWLLEHSFCFRKFAPCMSRCAPTTTIRKTGTSAG